jgi:hypothetical protein
MASDGRGGFWSEGWNQNGTKYQYWMLHRTAAGKWSRIAIPQDIADIALVPKTTSVWGGGTTPTTSGADAVIWAYGLLR